MSKHEEQETIKEYLFFLHGEVELDDYTEESAWNRLLDMSLRELLSVGLKLD